MFALSLTWNTGMIKSRKDTKHRFRINWDSRSIREQQHAMELESSALVGGREGEGMEK